MQYIYKIFIRPNPISDTMNGTGSRLFPMVLFATGSNT